MAAPDQPEVTSDQENVGLLAEFPDEKQLIAAAKEMRSAGFEKLDAFTPFPIHELDAALKVPSTRLPWLVLGAGLTGGAVAMALQWWTNAVDYPLIISGKPLFSLPANIPVTFEVIILAAAFTAFFGMLALNGLPKLANPLLRSERFKSVTSNGFFLLVEATDARFDPVGTEQTLRREGAVYTELLTQPTSSAALPRPIWLGAIVLGSLALLPPAMIASSRSTTSDKPRLHNFFDMDFQPKYKSQTTSTLFADGRAARGRVAGTVSRGTTIGNSDYLLGINSEQEATIHSTSISNDPNAKESGPDWVTEFPVSVTDQLIDRGQLKFNIHCAICHGKGGYGNGLASLRAIELQQGTWVPPTSIHADYVKKQPIGQLFNTITNGIRKMPAYGNQIPVEDRWAIVLYLRALQRSQDASVEDVPEQLRPTLREMN